MATLYGIANFANDFNKVREDALDSGFKAKNRFRADYLADYQMPAALALTDARTAKAQQMALINQQGFDDFVNKGLYGIAKDAKQAENDYDTYLASAPYLQQGSINKAKQGHIASVYGLTKAGNDYDTYNQTFPYEQTKIINNAKQGSTSSAIDLQKVEATDKLANWRQEAIKNGLTNETDIQRFIYEKSSTDGGSNPYLSNAAHEIRLKSEIANAKAKAATGTLDHESLQFLDPNTKIAFDGNGNYVVTWKDGSQSTLPQGIASTDAIISTIYGGDSTGMVKAQDEYRQHQYKKDEQEHKASLKEGNPYGIGNMPPSAPTTSAAAEAFSGGEPLRVNKQQVTPSASEDGANKDTSVNTPNAVNPSSAADEKGTPIASTGVSVLDNALSAQIEKEKNVVDKLSEEILNRETVIKNFEDKASNIESNIADISSELSKINAITPSNPNQEKAISLAINELTEKLRTLNTEKVATERNLMNMRRSLLQAKQDYERNQQNLLRLQAPLQLYGIASGE